MAKLGIIYKAVCSVTKKIYIGQTIRKLSVRKRGHKWEAFVKKDDSKFHRALRKHGMDNFMWEIICETFETNLCLFEIWSIAKYNSYSCGYNSTEGGDNNPMKYKEISKKMSGKNHPMYGKTHSESAKKAMSVARSGKNNPMYNKKHTDATKAKISKANSGKIRSDSCKKLMSDIMKKVAPFRGRSHTEESKKKISKTKCGSKWSEETRKKYAKAIKAKKGKRLSDYHRNKISEGHGATIFYVFKDNKLIGTWINQTECARDLNLSTSLLNRCLKRKQKTHKGYTFVREIKRSGK